MATQAQLDEKLRQDRLGVSPSSISNVATPAQLAEKAQQSTSSVPAIGFATPAQLAEKSRQSNSAMETSAFSTPAQLAEKATRGRPPPLPPRNNSAQHPPPAYTSDDAKRSELMSEQWRSHDPRSSSTHSLVPSESHRDGRRKLLLIYIHGFMGNELSFQSFPAHVHNLLSIALADTHIVHTKLYPRYKSRNSIEFARDAFSDWLDPHEDDKSDIVLLGHSMGGILGAEVALNKPPMPFRHRVLGTIGFDTPFLGMHPGVIVSGIGSLFRPAPEPPNMRPTPSASSGVNTPADTQVSVSSPSYAPSTAGSIESSQPSLIPSIYSPLASAPTTDPYFDAPFTNDVHIPERTGWSNLLHFVTKHSDGLANATKSYFMSHIEFGSCLADYPSLKHRYELLRMLEDVNDQRTGTENHTRRIRFLNYYTASTGRPKAPKPEKLMESRAEMTSIDGQMQDFSLTFTTSDVAENAENARIDLVDLDEDRATIPQIPTQPSDKFPIEEEMEHLGENSGVHEEFFDAEEHPEMRHIDSIPIQDDDEPPPLVPTVTERADEPSLEIQPTFSGPPLPPIPELPTEPEPIDLDLYTDKDSRKIAEKEQKRIMKAYQQAVKDRESAIKDREKLVEKRERKAREELEKKRKADEKLKSKEAKEKEKQRLKEEKEAEKQRLKEEKEAELKASTAPEQPRTREDSMTPSVTDPKPKRDKKFCMLPPTIRGQVDKCWVRIYMEGVDEVGAHCGLFFPGPQYESFVGDLGKRIEGWVRDDAAKRAARENASLYDA